MSADRQLSKFQSCCPRHQFEAAVRRLQKKNPRSTTISKIWMVSIEKVQRYDQEWTSLKNKLVSRQNDRFMRLAHCKTNVKVFESLTEFHVQFDRLANYVSPRGGRGRYSERKIRASSWLHTASESRKLQLEAVKNWEAIYKLNHCKLVEPGTRTRSPPPLITRPAVTANVNAKISNRFSPQKERRNSLKAQFAKKDQEKKSRPEERVNRTHGSRRE